ncbi:MAG TPA: hydroxymethylbilane synthase [Parafilimonas sp.]|nr:hydroxymethylbilane synthase [Parafilimonas sp.]
MSKILRIGTRDSQLAVWQATCVQNLLKQAGVDSELVYIKSEGDVDTITPLYALGVQGVFTRTLDAALLNNRIDIAVHSMKDVPVQLANGVRQAAVLKRGSHKDIFVYNDKSSLQELGVVNGEWLPANGAHHSSLITHDFIIATSSTRRMAQWLNRYPNHRIENLRGNVNTRLRKLKESNWNGAIFAAAGLERIDLRPENSVELDWMLPAPAQGAIMVACRHDDPFSFDSCQSFNDEHTALCTKIERDFLKELMGGCSTPIAGIAEMKGNNILFRGNILSPDGKEKVETVLSVPKSMAGELGQQAARDILQKGGQPILDKFKTDAK